MAVNTGARDLQRGSRIEADQIATGLTDYSDVVRAAARRGGI